MKTKLLLSALLLFAPAFAANADDTTVPKTSQVVKRHPLKGVITAVHADRSALMIKHEEIPGVMRAMTMMFKVDDATLKAAKPGMVVTGMMAREEGEWWLHDVKLAASPAK